MARENTPVVAIRIDRVTSWGDLRSQIHHHPKEAKSLLMSCVSPRHAPRRLRLWRHAGESVGSPRYGPSHAGTAGAEEPARQNGAAGHARTRCWIARQRKSWRNRLVLRDISKVEPLSHVTVPREGPVRCSRAVAPASGYAPRSSSIALCFLPQTRAAAKAPSHRNDHPPGHRRVAICCACGTICEFGFRAFSKTQIIIAWT